MNSNVNNYDFPQTSFMGAYLQENSHHNNEFHLQSYVPRVNNFVGELLHLKLIIFLN